MSTIYFDEPIVSARDPAIPTTHIRMARCTLLHTSDPRPRVLLRPVSLRGPS